MLLFMKACLDLIEHHQAHQLDWPNALKREDIQVFFNLDLFARVLLNLTILI